MNGWPQVANGWTAVWTRGEGCADLAAVLSTDPPRRVEGDLRAACIEAGADLLVAGALTSFDLVPTVVPNAAELDRITDVVAAVAGGAHSDLAARVAQRVASVVGVPGTLISVSQDDEGDHEAESMLDRIGRQAPLLERRVLRARSARALLGELGDDTLLVIGAPGGSWLQRQFFGPGKRLMRTAPNGIVVVRDAPERCYHRLQESVGPFGVAMPAADAHRVTREQVVPVVEEGRLVGIVRREALEAAEAGATVGDLMEDPVFVYVDDAVEDVDELADFLDGSPVPVIDHEAQLVGSVSQRPSD